MPGIKVVATTAFFNGKHGILQKQFNLQKLVVSLLGWAFFCVYINPLGTPLGRLSSLDPGDQGKEIHGPFTRGSHTSQGLVRKVQTLLLKWSG